MNKMMNRMMLLAPITVSLAAGCGLVEAPCDVQPGADAPDELAELLLAKRAELGAPGIAQVIVQGGATRNLILAGRDRFEPEACEGLTSETRFVSRSFGLLTLGLALELAEEQGHLGVEDPVTTWIPDLEVGRDSVAPAEEITLMDLMTSTSGLPESYWHYTQPCEGDALDDVIPIVANQDLRSEPGAFALPSEVGFTLVALAIERAVGQPFSAWVDEQLFAPLGVGATFDVGELEGGPHMRGVGGAELPACALLVPVDRLALSASDAAALLALLTSDGAPIFAPGALETLTAGRPGVTGDTGSGTGFASVFVNDTTQVASQAGYGQGVFSDILWAPEQRLAVATFVSQERGASLPLSLEALRVAGGPALAAYDHALPVSAWGAYEGSWVDPIGTGAGPRTLTIRRDGDVLKLRLDGAEWTAEPTAPMGWMQPNPFAGARGLDLFNVLRFEGNVSARVYRSDDPAVPSAIVAEGPPFYRQ